MKKYIVIYFSPPESDAKMATMTLEEQAQVMEPWMAWNTQYENNINDLGNPLVNGELKSLNGNWKSSNQNIGGYSIVQGKGVNEVKSIFEQHPHLSWSEDAQVGIFEIMEMG